MPKLSRAVAFLSPFVLFACELPTAPPGAKDKVEPADVYVPATPRGEVTLLEPIVKFVPTRTEVKGQAPDLGVQGPFFSNAGSFALTNTSLGQANFDMAPVLDWQSSMPPATFGTGGWSGIDVQGTTYATGAAMSVAGLFPDRTGSDFLVLSAFTEDHQPSGVIIGTVVHLIIPASDFAVGATVNLDGVDRLAIFARGDIDLPDPQLAAAAATGTVSFSAGGVSIGDMVTATLQADFGEIQWPTSPPPPPPPPGGGNITPGTYNLTYGPGSSVYCDGTLLGSESTFAAITPLSVGLIDGQVTLLQVRAGFDITGAPITSGFGSSTLYLDQIPDAPPGVVAGVVNLSVPTPGPLSTDQIGTYLALDGGSATPSMVLAIAGVGYINAAQDGFCQVDFEATLTP